MILGTLNPANPARDLLFGFHHFLTSVFCHFTCIDSIEWLSFHGLDYQRAFYKTLIAIVRVTIMQLFMQFFRWS